MRTTHSGTTMGTPRWAGDYFDRSSLIPGGARLDPAQFLAPDAVVVNVGAAGALAGAVAVPVDALTGPIPSGTVLDFGGAKFARLTADAAAAAVELTVAALPTALVDADVATYPGTLAKNIPSGTPIGRTFAEREAGTAFGPGAAADDEFFLTAFDIDDVALNPNVELYRPGMVVKENFLPGYATMIAGVVAKIRAVYRTTKGAD